MYKSRRGQDAYYPSIKVRRERMKVRERENGSSTRESPLLPPIDFYGSLSTYIGTALCTVLSQKVRAKIP